MTLIRRIYVRVLHVYGVYTAYHTYVIRIIRMCFHTAYVAATKCSFPGGARAGTIRLQRLRTSPWIGPRPSGIGLRAGLGDLQCEREEQLVSGAEGAAREGADKD